jgi:GntR family uxuAB operon transcriptional repressor
MKSKSDKRGSASIAGELRWEIVRGTFAINDKLPSERILANKYGVARGTVRGAIRLLETEALVETRAGSGTYVAQRAKEETNEAVVNTNPLELIDARFALEPHMCRLAVLNAKARDFAQFEVLLAEMEANTNDPTRFAELDTAFHSLIAETTGNSLLIWIVSEINSVRNQEQWSLMRHLTLNTSTIARYNVQHRQIVNAIRAREPERAAHLMKEHLETARLSLTRSAAT